MNSIDIIVSVPADGGWAPVWQMAKLLHTYTDGNFVVIDPAFSQKNTTKFLGLFPRIKRSNDKSCIVIVSDPGISNSILKIPEIFYKYKNIYLWVIDSFWSDRIPRIVKKGKLFDRCFVMDEEDLLDWSKQVSTPLGVMPWGVDVLGIDPASLLSKENDVVRAGRQPDAWSNNDINVKYFSEISLSYVGNPKSSGGKYNSEKTLEKVLESSKFFLAFNNLVSPANYTHPIKTYLTSRWVKGISYGALMLGAVPVSATAKKLIPDWGHVEISPTAQDDARATILRAYKEWDSSIPIKLHAHACRNLDWRYRFAQIFSDIGFKSEALEHDLKLLKQRAERLESPDD